MEDTRPRSGAARRQTIESSRKNSTSRWAAGLARGLTERQVARAVDSAWRSNKEARGKVAVHGWWRQLHGAVIRRLRLSQIAPRPRAATDARRRDNDSTHLSV